MHKRHHKHASQAHGNLTQSRENVQTCVARSGGSRNQHLVFPEDVRLRAYQKWENAGMPSGDGIQFWLEAELELVQEK